MIYTKDHKTIDIFDQFAFLGPKRRELIDKSWAKLFRDEILPELPVNKLYPFYSDIMGAPTKELYSMMGLMILQQSHDLTDDEAIHQFAFNIQWHYALNITNDTDNSAYLCHKTLWTMRSILTENSLYDSIFDSVTQGLAKLFDVNPALQRQDSVHIFSNMRHLGRIGLFVKTIKKFLVNLKRHHPDKPGFGSLEKELTDRYLSKQESLFSMVKPSESAKTLNGLSEDLFFLIERFKDNKDVTSMSSYNLLVRLLKEQCLIEEDKTGNAKKVTIKPNKEVPSDSLQNPSDPDAGYSGHKGKGFQVQVSETYDNNSDKEQKSLSLITNIKVESADKSDANALIPAIEATQKIGLGPEEILVDSLYGSDENVEKAKVLGAHVISPVMGKPPEKELSLAEFSFFETGVVETCPVGKEPVKTTSKKNRHTAIFNSRACNECSRLKDCPVKSGKKAYYLYYDDKAVRIAKRRAYEKTDEFHEKFRFRSGVEATMSYYDRKTGVKQLRVRGLEAVSFCATLKATGVNIFRATAFKNSEKKGKSPSVRYAVAISGFQTIKEQLSITIRSGFNAANSIMISCGYMGRPLVAT